VSADGKKRNGGSLFWTFAGVFLLVLAVATALQIVVNVVILRPLSESANHERVTRALDAVSAAVTATPDTPRDFDLMRLLHANRVPGGPGVLDPGFIHGRDAVH